MLHEPMTTGRANHGPVVLVGGANMDLTARALMPLASGDSTPGKIQWTPGGVVRNVAENLARLALATHLVSLVGDDLFGTALLNATRDAGVNVSAVRRVAGQRTATYLSLHGPDGDVAMAVNDMAVLECLGLEDLERHIELLKTAACLVVDCNLRPDAMAWLLAGPARRPATHSPVFVDGVSVAKCLRIMPWLNRIHTLKVNGMEAQALTGIAVATVHDACRAAAQLHQGGVRNVVVSLGAQGVGWCDECGLCGHRASPQLEVVSTSGAGDALLAGLIHACLNKLPLPQAVDFAMACAGITLASPYANAPQLSLAAVQLALSPNTSQHNKAE